MHTQKSTRIPRKLLSLLLTLGMILTMLPMGVWAEDTSSNTWTEVAWADITADDTIAITMTTSGGTSYVLPSAAATKAPTATVVDLTSGTLTAPPSAGPSQPLTAATTSPTAAATIFI